MLKTQKHTPNWHGIPDWYLEGWGRLMRDCVLLEKKLGKKKFEKRFRVHIDKFEPYLSAFLYGKRTKPFDLLPLFEGISAELETVYQELGIAPHSRLFYCLPSNRCASCGQVKPNHKWNALTATCNKTAMKA